MSPIIQKLSGEYIGNNGLTSPILTASRISKGLNDLVVTGNTRRLRNELLTYGPGFLGIRGGVQISRSVDALLAYSEGGVFDRRGRLLFRLSDPQDLQQAIFAGVWSTQEGQAYLEKRQPKPIELQKILNKIRQDLLRAERRRKTTKRKREK